MGRASARYRRCTGLAYSKVRMTGEKTGFFRMISELIVPYSVFLSRVNSVIGRAKDLPLQASMLVVCRSCFCLRPGFDLLSLRDRAASFANEPAGSAGTAGTGRFAGLSPTGGAGQKGRWERLEFPQTVRMLQGKEKNILQKKQIGIAKKRKICYYFKKIKQEKPKFMQNAFKNLSKGRTGQGLSDVQTGAPERKRCRETRLET